MKPAVLVGGKKREDVLANERRRLEQIARESPGSGEGAAPYPPTMTISPDFWFANEMDHCIINGVSYGEEDYQVLLYKNPLQHLDASSFRPEYSKQPFGDWLNRNQIGIQNVFKENPRVVPSASFLLATLQSIWANRNDERWQEHIAIWKNQFQQTLRSYELCTSTFSDTTENGFRVVDNVVAGTTYALSHGDFNAIFFMEWRTADQIIQWLMGQPAIFDAPNHPATPPLHRCVSLYSTNEGYHLGADTSPTHHLNAPGVQIWKINAPEGGTP